MIQELSERALRLQKINLMTFSVHLRTNMVASGRFIMTFPTSFLRFDADGRSLKALPVDLPDRLRACAIVTLKNRTLSPVVERFIEHIRDFTQPLRTRAGTAR